MSLRRPEFLRIRLRRRAQTKLSDVSASVGDGLRAEQAKTLALLFCCDRLVAVRPRGTALYSGTHDSRRHAGKQFDSSSARGYLHAEREGYFVGTRGRVYDCSKLAASSFPRITTSIGQFRRIVAPTPRPTAVPTGKSNHSISASSGTHDSRRHAGKQFDSSPARGYLHAEREGYFGEGRRETLDAA